jgi:DnaK suppressor protein
MLARKELIKKCESKLQQLKSQYLASLRRPRQYDDSSSEIIDRASKEQYLRSSTHFRERMQTLLPEIQCALARISDNSFGYCEVTGEEIEPRRLLAVPWTRISKKALDENS